MSHTVSIFCQSFDDGVLKPGYYWVLLDAQHLYLNNMKPVGPFKTKPDAVTDYKKNHKSYIK